MDQACKSSEVEGIPGGGIPVDRGRPDSEAELPPLRYWRCCWCSHISIFLLACKKRFWRWNHRFMLFSCVFLRILMEDFICFFPLFYRSLILISFYCLHAKRRFWRWNHRLILLKHLYKSISVSTLDFRFCRIFISVSFQFFLSKVLSFIFLVNSRMSGVQITTKGVLKGECIKLFIALIFQREKMQLQFLRQMAMSKFALRPLFAYLWLSSFFLDSPLYNLHSF